MEMGLSLGELKKGGFLAQAQKNYYIMRLRSINGDLTSEQLRKIADIADIYGQGEVHLTTRQGVEIPWISPESYNLIQDELKAYGLLTGTCGPRIRTFVVCPGATVCRMGIMDTKATGTILSEALFGQEVPMKTKGAISGCPNSCAKPQENDFGFMGQIETELNHDLCTGCGLCIETCPGKALTLLGNKPVIDKSKCKNEGNCLRSCPVEAWEEKRKGYAMYIGGKIGREPQLGLKIATFIDSGEVELWAIRLIEVYKRLAETNERIGNVVTRLGIEKFKEELKKEGLSIDE
jgi:anaerobic sulfite reductase subunit C